MDGWPQNICRCLTKITEVASINHPLPACLPAHDGSNPDFTENGENL